MGDFWVFGYASLIWQPGFDFEEAIKAHIDGYHRTLCTYSIIYRGTPEKPGLVFGLEKGGSCTGMAFRIAANKKESTLAYLRQREMIRPGYYEIIHPVTLLDGSGREVNALSYAMNQEDESYAGGLDRQQILSIVSSASGQKGSNRDYVFSTYQHLREAQIEDEELAWLCSELEKASA